MWTRSIVSCSVCDVKGGMKAVIWTDVVQTCLMFAGTLAVIIKGSVDHGGFDEIWSFMYDGDRIQFWEYAISSLYLTSFIGIRCTLGRKLEKMWEA